MINIDDTINKNRIALVSVGYNRIGSQSRLLASLLKADYSGFDNVPLVISIDSSGDTELYNYVNDFKWPYGEKYVIIQGKKLGLKKHIFKCGGLTKYFKGIILLEDDLYVAPSFYHYTVQVVDFYYNEPKVASISLYNGEMNGFCWLPFERLHNDSDVYAFKAAFSWGECWTERMWNDFLEWNSKTDIQWESVDMPPQISTWTKAWSKYFHAYMAENDLYSIVPYVSLTTNFSDAGEHGESNNTIVQVNLQYGHKDYEFKPFSELVRYDAFSNNILVAEHLQMTEKELLLDLYGTRENNLNKRFWITTRSLPYKVVKSFGLFLRPQELNVLYDIPGNGIFLYDTTEVDRKPTVTSFSNRMLYYLHGFNFRYMPAACWGYFITLSRKAIQKLSKKFGL